MLRIRMLAWTIILLTMSVGLTVGDAPVFAADPDARGLAPHVTYAAGDDPRSVVAADLNGNGSLDLVTANHLSDDVSVLLGNGDGTFAAPVSYGAGDEPRSVVAADLDGDTDLDLAVANRITDDVSVLLGNGDGTFDPAVSYATVAFPFSVVAVDLDGDTNLDLAVAATGSGGQVSVLLGNGDGTFNAAVSYDAGDEPRSVVAADLDGDDVLDLAVANRVSDDVSVLLGNGDGTFGTAVSYGAGDQSRYVVAADLNGDTDLDLAVANFGSGNVSVLLGNGDGTFATAVDYVAGNGPFSIDAADLDGDANLDLLVANLGPNIVSVLLGDGDGTFGTAVAFGTDNGPRAAIAADLDSDGHLDVTTANGASDNVSVLMAGPVTVSIDDVAVLEGNTGTTNAGFTVLSPVAPYRPATVDVTTANGTATEPDDYTSTGFDLTLPAGAFSTSFGVPVVGDTTDEPDETFNVSLSNPSSTRIGDGTGVGTILDDDPTPVLSIADQTVTEGGTATFTITASNPSASDITVEVDTADDTATAGDDYTAVSTQATIPAGQTQTTVDVVTLQDLADEPDETFIVDLSAPDNATLTGGDPQGLGTILDDDDYDRGDAPNSYATTVASNGPNHLLGSGPRLGPAVDAELDGLPTADADGDDLDGIDDEDGVTFPAPVRIGQATAPVTVNASGQGKLDAWADFDGNGSFDHPNEQIFASVDLVTGDNDLTFGVPVTAGLGDTFARFRLSSAGGLTPTGTADDGEVEDHVVTIRDWCGAVVSGTFVLPVDTGPCPADGLVIGAPGTVVDLGGHRLVGSGVGRGIVGSGVDAAGTVVRNGTISGFGTGLSLKGPRRIEASDLMILGSDRVGVRMVAARAVIEGLVVRDSGNTGILVRGIKGSVLQDNRVVGSAKHGIHHRDNRGDPRSDDHRSVIRGNRVLASDGHGIRIRHDRHTTRVTGNVVRRSDRFGIVAPDRPMITGKNTATGNRNGSQRQCRPDRLC